MKQHFNDVMPPSPEVKYSIIALSKDAIATINYLHQID